MLTLLFTILLFSIFGHLLWFSVKAAWGLGKIVVNIVLFPLLLIGLVLGGLIKIALPILLVMGIIYFVVEKA